MSEEDWVNFLTPQVAKEEAITENQRFPRVPQDVIKKWERSREVFELAKKKTHYSQHGKTYEVELPALDRYYVIHEPKRLKQTETLPLLLFFHGTNGCAWQCALMRTNWIKLANEHRFIVAFGQANGDLFERGPEIISNSVHWGNLFFEYQDDEELQYTQAILQDVQQRYSIDGKRIFCSGVSNGGVFTTILAMKFGKTIFRAMASVIGGWPKCYKQEYLKENEQQLTENSLPLLFVTGDTDTHLEYSQQADEYLKKYGYETCVMVEPNCGHTYLPEKELDVWKWFCKHSAEK